MSKSQHKNEFKPQGAVIIPLEEFRRKQLLQSFIDVEVKAKSQKRNSKQKVKRIVKRETGSPKDKKENIKRQPFINMWNGIMQTLISFAALVVSILAYNRDKINDRENINAPKNEREMDGNPNKYYEVPKQPPDPNSSLLFAELINKNRKFRTTWTNAKVKLQNNEDALVVTNELIKSIEDMQYAYPITTPWDGFRKTKELRKPKDPQLYQKLDYAKQVFVNLKKDIEYGIYRGSDTYNMYDFLKHTSQEIKSEAGENTDVTIKQEQIKVAPKIGRNDPCPCGSGKRYKNCHGKEV